MSPSRRPLVGLRVAWLAVLAGAPALGQTPTDPYANVDASDPVTLRATLHDAIDDHQRFPYSARSTDTWDILELADEDPADPTRIVDVYRNASYAKVGGGNPNYNREHLWPKSYGFPDDGADNAAYTDCHMLMLCDSGFNSTRSNKPFRWCDANCAEHATAATNAVGGGSGSYPGNSNWTSGRFSAGTWEVWAFRRGDVARAMFYMDVRYEGGVHGITGHPEPDLVLTDDEARIEASRTGDNEPVAYMGMRRVLLAWHRLDPVTDLERRRNDVVASFQGNRNPFVDHPEWVEVLFDPAYAPPVAPDPAVPDPDLLAPPAGLVAIEGEALVALFWEDHPDSDVVAYDVYRATVAGGPYARANDVPLVSSDFVDVGIPAGVTQHYVVVALDRDGATSGWSEEVAGTPDPEPLPDGS